MKDIYNTRAFIDS